VNRTKIPWCDYTWSPIVGCSPASDGCANCYAASISKRFHLPWGSAHFMPERLGQPAKVRKPGRVFVCSMADFGHETVQPEWQCLVSRAMQKAPWPTYIVLTKRPGPWLRRILPSCWVGVTIESQAQSIRWNRLVAWAWPDAPVRFVSVEPMLGPVSFRDHGIKPDWIIAGPETGPKARPCNPEWIADLAADCYEMHIPFFDKREGGIRREFPTEGVTK